MVEILMKSFSLRNRNIFFNMHFKYESHISIILWVTTIGLFLSLIEASAKIKYENYLKVKKRKLLVNSLYPKELI